jgi:hypothetical protein
MWWCYQLRKYFKVLNFFVSRGPIWNLLRLQTKKRCRQFSTWRIILAHSLQSVFGSEFCLSATSIWRVLSHKRWGWGYNRDFGARCCWMHHRCCQIWVIVSLMAYYCIQHLQTQFWIHNHVQVKILSTCLATLCSWWNQR